MTIRVFVTGDKELARELGRLERVGREVVKEVLLQKAAKIVALAKPLTPVAAEDGGELRDSIHNTAGTISRNGDVSVDVVAGGDAVPYALQQHEDLTLRHRVGGPKFLERPVFQVAPEIPTAIEDRLAQRLKGA